MNDLREVLQIIATDPELQRIADFSHVGAVGHSLGGYTVIGMAGGWPSWRTPEIMAVVALSPYVVPFIVHGTLGDIGVPVMYQGAQFDWITPTLEGEFGPYASTPSPKYFVKLNGGTHFEWTNLLCLGEPNVAACLDHRENARAIDRYMVAFLDRYLKGKAASDLDSEALEVDRFRQDP